MNNTGRLPRATGKQTDRVRRALHVYRRLWTDAAPRLSGDRRVVATAILHALIQVMTRAELAEYYGALVNDRGRGR